MSSLVSANNEHLELTNFYLDGNIHYNYVEIIIREWYSSIFNEPINGKYIFPIISGLHLAKLTVYKNSKLSVLKIQDSHKSLKSYQDVKNTCENTYTLEKLKEDDMMVYDIENIITNSTVQIEATYVCKAEQALQENYWEFLIPNTLFPVNIHKYPSFGANMLLKFSDINEGENYTCNNGNAATLDTAYKCVLYNNFDPNKDIELTYYKPFPQEPLIIVQKDPRIKRYAFHLSYKPDPKLFDSSEADQAGEFIIFLDRSGAMYQKFEIAIEAISLFIRSLPENCYFNVISYGNRWEKMFENSQKYDKCSADEACQIILQYKNDFGGPDLREPLENIFNNARIPGYPLHVFIITGAKLWDYNKEILKLIERHKYSSRVSMIGICTNDNYIDELTNAGGGNSQIINSIDQVKPAVLSSLKQALYPAFTNIRLSDPYIFDYFLPRENFGIFPDEKIEISGVFKKGRFPKRIGLKFKCQKLESFNEICIDINKKSILSSSSIFVLESKKYLKWCDKDLSIRKSKEYQIEGDYASFDIERYEKYSYVEEGEFISKNTQAEIQLKPQTNRKNLSPTTKINHKLEFIDDTTFSMTLETKSASKTIYSKLQRKRGRDKQTKIIHPNKKAKIDNAESKQAEMETNEVSKPLKSVKKYNKMRCANEVEKLIHLQNADGFWEKSSNLSNIANNLLGYDLDISNFNEKQTTALIVALFKESLKDYKYLWDLVVEKAHRWLRRNDQKILKLSSFEPINI